MIFNEFFPFQGKRLGLVPSNTKLWKLSKSHPNRVVLFHLLRKEMLVVLIFLQCAIAASERLCCHWGDSEFKASLKSSSPLTELHGSEWSVRTGKSFRWRKDLQSFDRLRDSPGCPGVLMGKWLTSWIAEWRSLWGQMTDFRHFGTEVCFHLCCFTFNCSQVSLGLGLGFADFDGRCSQCVLTLQKSTWRYCQVTGELSVTSPDN